MKDINVVKPLGHWIFFELICTIGIIVSLFYFVWGEARGYILLSQANMSTMIVDIPIILLLLDLQ